jgi:asparagine synthase (glutamine-hydrolysing)
VPNPYPQLADLILFPRPYSLFKQLAAWSLSKRRPITELFANALELCNPVSRGRSADAPAPWLEAPFVREHFPADRSTVANDYSPPWQPTKREWWQTFAAMTRQFAFFRPHGLQFEERRYPYLDQDLLQFLAAIPAEQLLRPGQRRSLMRRSLVGVVPKEILWRKTKGSASRTFIANLSDHWTRLEGVFASPLVCRLGYVNQELWMTSLRETKFGNVRNLMHVAKTLHLEFWLRMITQKGIVNLNVESQLIGEAVAG